MRVLDTGWKLTLASLLFRVLTAVARRQKSAVTRATIWRQTGWAIKIHITGAVISESSMTGISSPRIYIAHLYRAQTIAMISNHMIGDPYIDDLHRSTQMSDANDYDVRPHTEPIARGRKTRRIGGPAPITDDVSKREDNLKKLRWNLDPLACARISNNMERAPNGSSSSTICTAQPFRAQTIMDRAKTIMTPVGQPIMSGGTPHAAPVVHPRPPTMSASVTTAWSRLRRDLNSLVQSSKSA